MKNKQIIIDDVDVSGCVNFRPDVETTQVNYTNACSIGIWQRWYTNIEPSCIMSCSCKQNTNCYYKNWKRKEQECDMWKNLAIDNGAVALNYQQQLKAKEQECEELKEKLILKEVAIIELSDDVKKYSKAIDEIEEIADNNYEIAEMKQIFLIIGGLDV